MKILVDADACPVKHLIVKVAKEYNIPVVMLTDTTHILYDDYSEIITVEKGMNSVDIVLVNKAKKGDIAVTQDYGVAAMCLGKSVYVINNSGFIYTNDNIERLLFERHLSQKTRRAGGKTTNPRKRTIENDIQFETCLRKFIANIINPRSSSANISE